MQSEAKHHTMKAYWRTGGTTTHS